MATKLIRVRAAPHLRRELARWGRTRRSVRTVSSTEIGFPPQVFAQVPEELLAGALVDSQPYTPRAAAKPGPAARGGSRGRNGGRDGGAAAKPRAAATGADRGGEGLAAAPVAAEAEPNDPAGEADGDAAAAEVTLVESVTTAGPEATPTEPVELGVDAAAPVEPVVADADHLVQTPAEDGCSPPQPDPTAAAAERAASVAEVAMAGPAVQGDTGMETAAGEPAPDHHQTVEQATVAPAAVARETTRHGKRRGRGGQAGTQHPCNVQGCTFVGTSAHALRVHRGRAHGGGGESP